MLVAVELVLESGVQFKGTEAVWHADCSAADLKHQGTPAITVYLKSSDKILRQLLQAESTEHSVSSLRYQTQGNLYSQVTHIYI